MATKAHPGGAPPNRAELWRGEQKAHQPPIAHRGNPARMRLAPGCHHGGARAIWLREARGQGGLMDTVARVALGEQA